MKKCLVMPDSFKGTISAVNVCRTMETCLSKEFPDCEVQSYPIADGGEGTVDCFLRALPGGKRIDVKVEGPCGQRIDSFYGRFNDTAVIEMASAAGLSLCTKPDPAKTSTFGVGQLILHAVNNGAVNIILGLGGSCTNDGGAGMAAALGTKFFDHSNNSFVPVGGTLDRVKQMDNSQTIKTMSGVNVRAMCDIDNPMYGENGATYVFAPQKGGTPDMLPVLDRKMKSFANVIKCILDIDLEHLKGGGAAGGLGAGAYAFLGAELVQGIDIVLDLLEFEKKLESCNIVFTGEGRLDKQSLGGKAIIGIGKHAKKMNVPVISVVGAVAEGMTDLHEYGIHKVYATSDRPLPNLNRQDLEKYCIEQLEITMGHVINDIKKR